MALGDLNILGFLKTKMKWHQARQRLLAENVANADTPRYRPQDLKGPRFDTALAAANRTSVTATRTNAAHLSGRPAPEGGAFKAADTAGWERTPAGNAVVLEEQMLKVAGNQFDFQMASSLYARSLGLIRTALGRNA